MIYLYFWGGHGLLIGKCSETMVCFHCTYLWFSPFLGMIVCGIGRLGAKFSSIVHTGKFVSIKNLLSCCIWWVLLVGKIDEFAFFWYEDTCALFVFMVVGGACWRNFVALLGMTRISKKLCYV